MSVIRVSSPNKLFADFFPLDHFESHRPSLELMGEGKIPGGSSNPNNFFKGVKWSPDGFIPYMSDDNSSFVSTRPEDGYHHTGISKNKLQGLMKSVQVVHPIRRELFRSDNLRVHQHKQGSSYSSLDVVCEHKQITADVNRVDSNTSLLQQQAMSVILKKLLLTFKGNLFCSAAPSKRIGTTRLEPGSLEQGFTQPSGNFSSSLQEFMVGKHDDLFVTRFLPKLS
ncbi:hypothetical protein HPP92_017414 [Vanilla planifolia]|uniref:Uncharacterized protein n=1 Tax=Vanilla planifolia TaxID=51239 RepID=A0A835UQJ6_VANPL|nr:hypothetical protein HPP92_017414 [Vanilla planifolia]